MGTATWQPKWWTEETHGSAWGKVKEAMKRDWEQTKADFNAGGRELNQDVDDTLKQAAGAEVIPPRSQPNAPGGTDVKKGPTFSWDDAEPPMAFGYGARQQFGAQHTDWNENLEKQLQNDWESTSGTNGRKWNEVQPMVRRGYDRARS